MYISTYTHTYIYISQLTFTCSKSTIETLEKCVKCVKTPERGQ